MAYESIYTGPDVDAAVGKADAARVGAGFTALGNSTNITVDLAIGQDKVYTATLTGDGTLTINATAEFSQATLHLKSNAAGTHELGVAGTPEWSDGTPVALAPDNTLGATGETIEVLITSVANVVSLSARSRSTPV